jgi:hypothetical protein
MEEIRQAYIISAEIPERAIPILRYTVKIEK